MNPNKLLILILLVVGFNLGYLCTTTSSLLFLNDNAGSDGYRKEPPKKPASSFAVIPMNIIRENISEANTPTPDIERSSQEYPCKNFKLKYKEGWHNRLRPYTTPANKMAVLYSLANKLSTVDTLIGIDFVLLHGSLIGQYLTKRALPWDDDLDVSISENHGVALNQYIRSLKFVGTKGLQEYFQDSEGFLWYIDESPHNHIENRLFSPCLEASAQNLMTDSDKDTCARFYVDITILYEDSDVHVKKVVSKHRNQFQKGGRNVRFPDEMSSDVFIYKALRIGEEDPKKQWILSLAHVFNKEDIYPVSKCEFNGVLLSCPKNVVKLLTQEYSSVALRPTYKNYKLAENGCWE